MMVQNDAIEPVNGKREAVCLFGHIHNRYLLKCPLCMEGRMKMTETIHVPGEGDEREIKPVEKGDDDA